MLDEYIILAALLGIINEAQAQFSFACADYMIYSMYYPQPIGAVVEVSNSIDYANGARAIHWWQRGGGDFGEVGGGTR